MNTYKSRKKVGFVTKIFRVWTDLHFVIVVVVFRSLPKFQGDLGYSSLHPDSHPSADAQLPFKIEKPNDSYLWSNQDLGLQGTKAHEAPHSNFYDALNT